VEHRLQSLGPGLAWPSAQRGARTTGRPAEHAPRTAKRGLRAGDLAGRERTLRRAAAALALLASVAGALGLSAVVALPGPGAERLAAGAFGAAFLAVGWAVAAHARARRVRLVLEALARVRAGGGA
jgi:hypothetical protein